MTHVEKLSVLYNMTYVYNKATLSGGITFQNTCMFVYSFVNAEFVNNVGGNGGAMAFHQKSVVYALLRKGQGVSM